MVHLLQLLPATPAMVLTDVHVPLMQNRLAVALLGALEPRPGRPGSFVLQWFTDPRSRRRYHVDEHDHQLRVLVADLRTATARRGRDPEVTELVDTLRSSSAEFAQLWDRSEVAVRRADRKRLVHPDLGVIETDCLSLLSEDGTQRLLWFTPAPGGTAAEQFAHLLDDGPAAHDDERHPDHRVLLRTRST